MLQNFFVKYAKSSRFVFHPRSNGKTHIRWANFIYKTWATCKQFFLSIPSTMSPTLHLEKAMKMCFVFLWLSPNCHFRMCDVCGIKKVFYKPFYKWMVQLCMSRTNFFIVFHFDLWIEREWALWMWIINFNSNDCKCFCVWLCVFVFAEGRKKWDQWKTSDAMRSDFFTTFFSPSSTSSRVFSFVARGRRKNLLWLREFFICFCFTRCDSHTIIFKSITSLCH